MKKVYARAFALQDSATGHIVAHSIRWAAKDVRAYAVETDAEYALADEDMDPKAVWRRHLREGWRVVPVKISTI